MIPFLIPSFTKAAADGLERAIRSGDKLLIIAYVVVCLAWCGFGMWCLWSMLFEPGFGIWGEALS